MGPFVDDEFSRERIRNRTGVSGIKFFLVFDLIFVLFI